MQSSAGSTNSQPRVAIYLSGVALAALALSLAVTYVTAMAPQWVASTGPSVFTLVERRFNFGLPGVLTKHATEPGGKQSTPESSASAESSKLWAQLEPKAFIADVVALLLLVALLVVRYARRGAVPLLRLGGPS